MSIFVEIFILNFSNNFVALSFRITTQHLSGISDNVRTLILLPYMKNSTYNMTDNNSNTSSDNSKSETEFPNFSTLRSSHQVFCKKRWSQKFRKTHRKVPVPETLAHVFSCEFCQISKNTIFIKHFWATTSVL